MNVEFIDESRSDALLAATAPSPYVLGTAALLANPDSSLDIVRDKVNCDLPFGTSAGVRCVSTTTGTPVDGVSAVQPVR